MIQQQKLLYLRAHTISFNTRQRGRGREKKMKIDNGRNYRKQPTNKKNSHTHAHIDENHSNRKTRCHHHCHRTTSFRTTREIAGVVCAAITQFLIKPFLLFRFFGWQKFLFSHQNLWYVCLFVCLFIYLFIFFFHFDYFVCNFPLYPADKDII